MGAKGTKRPLAVVGLSGGVDSAVSALLLKQQNYDVVGIYMVNWDKELNGDVLGSKRGTATGCSSELDYKDAQKVAAQLGIELIKVNYVKEYWRLVFEATLRDYADSLTPNPDVLCNRFIKFGILKDYVDTRFPGALLATGHYADVASLDGQKCLRMPKDRDKDQTYFLCALRPEQLERVAFPLAGLDKSQVRGIAKRHGLWVADKKDSTGICFIGERDFKAFLQNYFPKNPGPIVLLPDNRVVGTHDGVIFYTTGQRQGLNLGGMRERAFVVRKDPGANALLVACESDAEAYLASDQAVLGEFNWMGDPSKIELGVPKYYVRFRHRQPLVPCAISRVAGTTAAIAYPQKSRAVAPGQYAAIYDGSNICCGGGKIIESSLADGLTF